ncbi:MAG: carbohydrate ABC transporter substrate-binding protein, partial [Lachnospiraceae bacterium]|nr:carbohydrate ABC transporter substrate-binding protein [Lachnospiraceae bacterium]
TLTLYNGYDHGILIDDSDSLWCYLPGQGAPEHILNWGDSTIGLKQYTIDAIGVLENKSLYIAAHRPSQDITLVNISNKDALEITETPEIQVVTVGILKQYEKVMELSLNKEIEEYKEKTGHQAELCSYDSVLDLELALVRGEGPDIICLGLFGLDADILAAKGVLEDLEPYFEMSSNLKMEDLLLAVREAGTINEKFRCVIESFAISGALVKEGITDNGSWTVEDYIKLGEENPDIPLSLAYGSNKDWYRTSVLDYILEWNRMWYVDWKEKKCYFDSVNFVSLLERISRLEIHWNENEDYGVKKEDYMERVFQQQELVGEWSVGDPSSFVYYMEAMDTEYGSLELAGYPSQEKGPYCRLKAIMSLGINSASLNKDRAWQFLAFLLSEDHQKEISSNIPVRSDSFENFLNTEKNGVCLSENEKELFRYLVEHAHWKANSLTDKILSIIHEEVAPVWAGDRTAEQAANIIQNRVSVYLNE